MRFEKGEKSLSKGGFELASKRMHLITYANETDAEKHIFCVFTNSIGASQHKVGGRS